MTVYVLVIYGRVVGVFDSLDYAHRTRKRQYPQDEYRLYECVVRREEYPESPRLTQEPTP